jgi:hypothetical protein
MHMEESFESAYYSPKWLFHVNVIQSRVASRKAQNIVLSIAVTAMCWPVTVNLYLAVLLSQYPLCHPITIQLGHCHQVNILCTSSTQLLPRGLDETDHRSGPHARAYTLDLHFAILLVKWLV